MAEYPRVLVVNAGPFNRRFNHGINLSNLFGGWPKDRLAAIGLTHNLRPDFDVCERYWLVTRSGILRGLVGKPPRRPFPVPNSAKAKVCESHHSAQMDRLTPYGHLLRRLVPQAVRVPINEACYQLPTVLSDPLRSWIADFNPDLLFSMLGTAALLKLNVNISRWRNIPCMPYFTDDWISWKYSRDFLSAWLRPTLEYWFDQYLQRAPLRLAISPAMAEEYRNRYRGEFGLCMDCIAPDNEEPSAKPKERGNILTMMFLGTLKPDRWRSLREIGEALLELRSEGFAAQLVVYSLPADIEQFGKLLKVDPVLKLAGTARPQDVPRLQREADVLVHTEAFDEASVVWTRFSMSTKIPQYLMSGRCIFAYGPGEVSSMRYLADTGSALTVEERNPQLLRKALRELIVSEERRRDLGRRARAVAMENHEASRQQERLRQFAVKACENWQAPGNGLGTQRDQACVT